MHEVEEKVKKLSDLKTKITSYLDSQIETRGVGAMETEETGKVVDMIKDLAEAEKNCWKAYYYKTVVESMKEQKEDSRRFDDGPMGYNHNHYASGRFAPSGRGHYVAGYMPPYMMGMGYEEDDYLDQRMGYSGGSGSSSGGRGGSGSSGGGGGRGSSGSSSGGGSSRGSSGGGNRGGGRSSSSSSGYTPYEDMSYGKAFGEWEDARRHYHESNSLRDKSEMDDKALEHMDTSMMTLKEIWKEADPDLKRKMQPAVEALSKELKMTSV